MTPHSTTIPAPTRDARPTRPVNSRIITCLYAAVDEVSRTVTGPPLAKSPDTALFGGRSDLDSLGLINFVVAAEQAIERDFGTPIMLADDRALSQEPSPFRSIGALADYIEALLAEKT